MDEAFLRGQAGQRKKSIDHTGVLTQAGETEKHCAVCLYHN